MLEIIVSNQFKKDLKNIAKRKYNLELLEEVVETLASQQVLAEKYCDHELNGAYRGFRECHIKPDWLLIYRIHKDKLILFLSRTGSHSDLFE